MKYEVKIVRLDQIQDKVIEIVETIENCSNYIIQNAFVTFYLSLSLPSDNDYQEINIASFPQNDIVSIKKIDD
jgi:hypothetical protein